MEVPEYIWDRLFLQLSEILTYIMLIPILVALFYKQYWNRSIYYFFIFCLLTFVLNLFEQSLIWLSVNYSDFIIPILDYWSIQNTFFVQIFFYLKNFLLLGLFYSSIFPERPYDRYILKISQLLALAAVINYVFIEGYHVHGIFNPFANAIFIVILPLLYLWYSQKQSLRISLKKNPYLWMSLGIFLPKLIGLFLSFSGDTISKDDLTLYYQLQILKNTFEIVGQLLIAIGFAHSYYARFIQTAEQQ